MKVSQELCVTETTTTMNYKHTCSAALFGLMIVSCSNQKMSLQTSDSSVYQSPLSAQVYKDSNLYRNEVGAGTLQRHAGLDRLALQHCEYLRANRGKFNLHGKNVSHSGSEGRSMMAMKAFQMLNCSENVAWTSTTGSDAVTSSSLLTLWKRSSSHDAALRDPSWTHTGVGTLRDADGTVFATQLFGTANRSQMIMRDRFNSF